MELQGVLTKQCSEKYRLRRHFQLRFPQVFLASSFQLVRRRIDTASMRDERMTISDNGEKMIT